MVTMKLAPFSDEELIEEIKYRGIKFNKFIDDDELDKLANKEYPDFIYRDKNMSNKSHRDAFKKGCYKVLECISEINYKNII